MKHREIGDISPNKSANKMQVLYFSMFEFAMADRFSIQRINKKQVLKQKSAEGSIDVLSDFLQNTMVFEATFTRFLKRKLDFETFSLRLQKVHACQYARFAQKRKADHRKKHFRE